MSAWDARLPGETASAHRARVLEASKASHIREARAVRDFLDDLARTAWRRMYEVGRDDGFEEYCRVMSAIDATRIELRFLTSGRVGL